MKQRHIWPVKIGQVFPPEDKLATIIVRICILREDAMIEMLAIAEENLGKLDRPNAQYRKFYFLRSLIRTHSALCSAVQTLLVNPELKQLLTKQSQAQRNEFKSKFGVFEVPEGCENG
jgi:hypothetical protein